MLCRDKSSASALPRMSQWRGQRCFAVRGPCSAPDSSSHVPEEATGVALQSKSLKPIPVARAVRALSISTPGSIPVHHPPPITPASPCPGAAPCKHCRSCVNTGSRYFPHLSLADRRAAPFPRKNKPTQWRRRVQQVFPQISSMSREVAVNRLTAQRQPWKFLTASFLSQIHTSAFPPGP